MNAGTPMNERGGCLTVYLLATVLFAILSLLSLLALGAAAGVVNVGNAVAGTGVSTPVFPIIISIVSIVVVIVGVYGSWNWKKWGIYLIVASFVITALGSIFNGSFIFAILGLVIECAILWWLVKDKWAAFQG